MDTYCWIHSTFSISGAHSGLQGVSNAHPGVAPPGAPPGYEGEGDQRHHKYYQWVCFMLFFQAGFFYFPRLLWKIWEGGKCNMLVQEMNLPMVQEDDKKDRIKNIIDYFTINMKNHDFYAIKFFFCELLNCINVLGQIWLTHFFLGFEFTNYGTEVLAYAQMSEEERESVDDPLTRVFPRVTKCTFHKFGPSGTVERFDGLCVLPLNIINEKIYVGLWFWFLFLAGISLVQLVYRLLCMFSPTMRVRLLHMSAKLAPKHQVQTICDRHGMGDWFLMKQLSKNIDPLIFRDFIQTYHKKLSQKEEKDDDFSI